jgi:hypothetical protein
LSTGRRDWNGSLRTMVITIHELPVGPFIFFQCLSGTELLNLSETPYVIHLSLVLMATFGWYQCDWWFNTFHSAL